MKSVLQSVSPRGIRASLIAFLFLGLIFSPLSSAQADGTAPPFSFSQTTPLVLDADAPSAVSLVNQSRADLSAQVWLTDFGFEPLSAETEIHWPLVRLEWGKEYVTDQDALKPLTVKLGGGQAQSILLSLNGAELEQVKPGTYTAFVMAGEAGQSSQVAHLEIRVAVEKKPAAGLPKPLSEAVTLQALRPFPFFPAKCAAPCLLPLDVADAKSVEVKAGQSLGFLVGPHGEYVQVRANQVLAGDNQPVGLGLDLQGLGGAGAYTAKLDLTKAEDKSGVVTVTVNVKDAVWFPLIVLLAGLGAAFLAQRYIAVGRKVKELSTRAGALFEKAEKLCIQPFKIDEKQWEGRRTALVLQLKELQKIAAPSLEDSNADYKAAIAELDAIESQIELWQSFGEKYKELKDAFGNFKETDPGDKPDWPILKDETEAAQPGVVKVYKFPLFRLDAESLVAGRTVQLAEAATVTDKVEKATLLLQNWKTMNDTVRDYRARIQALMDISQRWPEPYRLDLYSADRTLCQAWGDLWLAKDADDLTARSASADIQHAEALLLGLHDAHLVPTSSGVKDGGYSNPTPLISPAVSVLSLASFFSIFGLRVVRPADIELNASYSNLLRWLREGAIAILALSIALSAAATSLYIDKNFGTWQDYLAAFTWGVTTKALVSGLDYAIGNFRGTLPDLKA